MLDHPGRGCANDWPGTCSWLVRIKIDDPGIDRELYNVMQIEKRLGDDPSNIIQQCVELRNTHT